MARASPPDLDASSLPLRALARSYPRGLYVEPHQHEWGQLLYAMSGIMWVETSGEALLVPPQRGVWLPAGVPHGIRVASELEMRNIYLRPQLAQSLADEVQVFEVRPLLRELILALVEQERQPDADYYTALTNLAVQELQRAKRSQLRVPLPQGNDRRLLRLCQEVMAAPSLDISFEQHAQAVGASVRTLSRLLLRDLGMGFAEWRRQVQLASASAALIQGEPIGRIARELGYQPASFSDMFRRELGMAPSSYRDAAHG